MDRKAQLKNDFRSIFENYLDKKIERYLEINHQSIIAGHYFAHASTECIYLYSDGYFISAILLSQAVCEGIMKLILEKNKITNKNDRPEILNILTNKKIVTKTLADASLRIWKSFRNDYHHMNPKVGKLDHQEIAKRNISDLAIIEKEIFGFKSERGRLKPNQPLYWDGDKDTVSAYLRLL